MERTSGALLPLLVFDGVPIPSPDGRWIAFQRGIQVDSSYHWELYLVDAAGQGERQLTRNRWNSEVPSWYPDGRRLVMYANPAGRNQLFSLDLASGSVTELASSMKDDNAPAVSPDGQSIAFVSTREGSRDLYRLEVGTGVVIRLSTGMDIWSQPSWSPDGRRIIFSARANGVHRMYVVGADGTDLQQLGR